MITSLLDEVLDRTVIAGYTNIGYRVRSRGWSASELQRMDGKVVLVTGASSGLGLAAAEGFARLGATVWLVVRRPERGEEARMRIVERSGNGDVHVGVCDLSEPQHRWVHRGGRRVCRRLGDALLGALDAAVAQPAAHVAAHDVVRAARAVGDDAVRDELTEAFRAFETPIGQLRAGRGGPLPDREAVTVSFARGPWLQVSPGTLGALTARVSRGTLKQRGAP